MLEPKTLAGFLAVIAFTIGANLMLKLGAGASEAERVFGMLGWKSVAGLVLCTLSCCTESRSTSLRCLRRRSLSRSSSLPA